MTSNTVNPFFHKQLRFFLLPVISLCLVQALLAQAIRPGFTTAPGSQERNDDTYTGPIPIGFTVNFFGNVFSSVYVGTNGYVTFQSGQTGFTPANLTTYDQPILAPFYADVDTRNQQSGLVSWGQGMVNGRQAFAVTWNLVGYYRARADKLNAFQLVMIDRSDRAPNDFDFEFNYDRIQWEAGDANSGSSGICVEGCEPPSVGFSNGLSGTLNKSFEYPGSHIAGAFLDSNLQTGLKYQQFGSNGVRGRLLFPVTNGTTVTTQALTVSPTTLPAGLAGSSYSAIVTAAGGTGPYTFSSQGNIGVTVSSTGALTGTIPAGTAAGFYPLDIMVVDHSGASLRTVVALPVNTALQLLTSSPLPAATEGIPYSAIFQGKGGSGPYIFTASGLPSYFTLNSSGALSGTPAALSAGNVSFQVTVTDAGGMSVTGNYAVQVLPPAVIFQSVTLPNATEKVPYSATLQASSGTGPYTFIATGLPSWSVLNPNGTLSGTPPVGSAGANNVVFTVTDSRGATQSMRASLVVLAARSGLAVTTATPLNPATVGTPYALTLSAAGGSGPYTWSATGVPAGLNVSTAGRLVGTPTTPGNYNLTVQATDQNGKIALSSLQLMVVSAPLAITTPSPLTAGQVGQSYSVQIDATGGTGPRTWKVQSGTLPDGLTLSSDGILSGVANSVADSTFTLQAADAAGQSTSQTYQIAIKPVGSNLLLSQGSLMFKAVANGSVPTPQNIALIATGTQPPNYTVSAQSPWLSVSPTSGTAPAKLAVSVNQAGLAPGTYTDTIYVYSTGIVLKVPVTLVVASVPGSLATSPQSISLVSDGSSPLNRGLLVNNGGSTAVDFTASADQPWISLGRASGTVAPNSSALIPVTLNANALSAGSYNATIHLDSASSSLTVPVSLLLSPEPQMILDQQGVLLESRAGNGVSGPAVRSFQVLSTTSTPVNYTVTQIGGDNFLTLTTSSGTAVAGSPGVVSFTVSSAGLSTGSYYARLEVSSRGAVNSPQEYVVILNVEPPVSALPVPDPSPSGLTFIARNRTAPAQTVVVYTSSDQPVSFQTSVETDDGAKWLAVDQTSGILSTTSPASLVVSVDSSQLPPGVYTGGVNISIQNLSVRTVNITLIVTPGSTSTATSRTRLQEAAATCQAARLVMTQVGLPNNFAKPASWPQPVSVRVNNNCGDPVTNAEVVASFSNGDPPTRLMLTDPANGVYVNYWTPVYPLSQVTITTTAQAEGLPSLTNQITGGIAPNAKPIVAVNGTLHNLYPQTGAALAPGTIVEIFGSNLTANTGSATAVPLSNRLNNTQVLVEGKPIPLYYVSPTQINALLPADLVAGRQYQVIVNANGAFSLPQPFNTQPVTPGVAVGMNGQVTAQHSDFSLVTPQAPAKPGEFLVIYLAGLGATNQTITDGTPAPSSPLASASIAPIVRVDGQPAKVFFAGLTPGSVGLYQINFQVPPNASSGPLKLEISQAGVPANVSVLLVQ